MLRSKKGGKKKHGNYRLPVLTAYYAEFGTISNITQHQIYNYMDQEVQIGVLINNLRSFYKKGKLKQDEIDELEAMGMIWQIGKGKRRDIDLDQKTK